MPRTLGEILIKHGRTPLSDPKLCENLLKDYCPEFKEEISLLVQAVRERIPSDLLVSQEGLPRDLLRALLVKRLRKGGTLSEGEARWVVESWRVAIRALSRAESGSSLEEIPAAKKSEAASSSLTFGVVGRCEGSIRSLAVSSGSESIVSGGDDGVVRLWQPRSGGTTIVAEQLGPVWALAFSPNGVLVASASGERDVAIQITDVQSRETVLLGQTGRQTPAVVFSPGGKSLASSSSGARCEVQLWNLQTGQMRVLKGEWKGPSSISFSPDGRQIAVADSDLSSPAIRVWDLETATTRQLGQATRQITSVAYLPDGRHLASGSWDETVRLWNVDTGEARVLGENCACVCRIAISTRGDRLAAYSLDGKLRVWDVQSGRSRIVGECFGVNAISFINDALVTGGDDGTIQIWKTGI